MTSRPASRFGRLARFATRGRSGWRNGLTRCPECRRSFMCPMAWETAGESHWVIQLRCGACGERREVRVGNADAAAFDVALDRQIAPMVRALARLDRERMEIEVETFVVALQHDLVDAADFAH